MSRNLVIHVQNNLKHTKMFVSVLSIAEKIWKIQMLDCKYIRYYIWYHIAIDLVINKSGLWYEVGKQDAYETLSLAY